MKEIARAATYGLDRLAQTSRNNSNHRSGTGSKSGLRGLLYFEAGPEMGKYEAKFDAGCGWPAFEENFDNAVLRLPDADGSRIEIQCTNCKAHLGHVFEGEKMTEKDTRHCVNSLSIKFISKGEEKPEVIRP